MVRDTTVADKAALRRDARAALERLTAEQRALASTHACAMLASTGEFAAATRLMLFLSMPHEVDTAALLRVAWAAGKAVAVPRITADGQLEALPLTEQTRLRAGPLDIREPVSGDDPIDPASIEMIVAPGLAFDRGGGRLGHGGGYYDRFLPRAPGAWVCGLGFDCQLWTVVPMAAHDRRIHAVATPSGLYRAAHDPRPR